MVYLEFDTSNQTAYFTLDEGRLLFDTAFTHYLCVMVYMDGSVDLEGNRLAQVLDVVNENARITEVTMTTEGLINAGDYYYVMYGQNSSTNLDENNASVVGIVERGRIRINSEVTPFAEVAGQNEIITID